MQTVFLYQNSRTMHRFPIREARKSSDSPIHTTRNRSLSALSVLQPPLHTRASSVVRKVLGARLSLKGSPLFVDTTGRSSWDKPSPSADSTRPKSRPRRNTSPNEVIGPKDISVASPNHVAVSASPGSSSPTFRLALPVDSLLFAPTPNTPPSDDLQHMASKNSTNQSDMSKSSPERSDSGYASGQSSAASPALAGASPIMPRTPQTLGKSTGVHLTTGAMNMRLSPSETRSMMPMPILNLPSLPPASAPDHTLPRTRSLQPGEMRHVKKSMPALMRHGTSNMAVTHTVDEDDGDEDGDSESSSDSSDSEEAVPTEGDSSPEARDSIDESVDQSGSEGTDYFDAPETRTPGLLEDSTAQSPSGLVTPRASEQNNALLGETSALGLQIPMTPRPSTISSSSPWTLVDATPGADRAVSGRSTRMDYFSHPVAAARQAFKSPHRTPRVSELRSLASPSRVNASTPRVLPTSLSPANTIAARRARAATALNIPDDEPARPALYKQVSQSMMNLSSPPYAEGMALSGLDTIRSPLRTPREGMPILPGTPGTPAAPPPIPLMRRNSMPTMIRHPPNYNDLYPSMPREEEGKEKLPSYSCGIHIEAMMPRKMEFSAPGVLAKDRGWKKHYIVLHGTSLMVYKNDIRKFPIGGKVKGKEKYEGVVTEDEVDLSSPTVHLPGYESAAARPNVNPPKRRSSKRTPSLGTGESGSRSSLLSRFHGNSSRSTVVPQEPSPVDDKASASHSTVSLSASSSGSTTKRWSHNQSSSSFASLPHFNPPFSSGNALVRHYSLQKSESGLGSDYYKRRNVIRVRSEGEQFLLQAENVMQVVDWIECLQAATNVALDLDERPMTKPPPFPRRRRRRRVRPADEAGATQATGGPASGENANASNDNTTR